MRSSRSSPASGSALAYSSYLGGTGNDAGTAIAVASKGNAAHVTGSTASADYPITPGAVDPSHNGGDDAFMATFVKVRRGARLLDLPRRNGRRRR